MVAPPHQSYNYVWLAVAMAAAVLPLVSTALPIDWRVVGIFRAVVV